MTLPHPWEPLERGHPLTTLHQWRRQLLADDGTIALHLTAATAGLRTDPLAELRRQALALLAALAEAEPGETEISQLGSLLRGWGALCLSHAPDRAQQHLERAWACGPDPRLEQQLADLYARQGMATGALALAAPSPVLAPWPHHRCAGLHCQPCQQRLSRQPQPPQQDQTLISLAGGRCWIERQPVLEDTHGLATASASGDLVGDLCRRYPWHWPGCRYAEARQDQSLRQLAWTSQAPPLVVPGPVLAVADLSAELYYHGQLELLPRLGRAWRDLAPQLPGLRLWHNGGRAPWLQEAFRLLRIPSDRLICAHRHPHLQAEQLLVPSFSGPFGTPSAQALTWLRTFWGEAVAALPPAAEAPTLLLLSRPHQQRRPLLQHLAWQRHLERQGGQIANSKTPLLRQLQTLQQCERVVAAHGGALTNLLLLPEGAELLELANPAYTPPYFAGLLASGRLCHSRRIGATTPQVLQDLLYAGPLEWPIDLPPSQDP